MGLVVLGMKNTSMFRGSFHRWLCRMCEGEFGVWCFDMSPQAVVEPPLPLYGQSPVVRLKRL